MSASPIFCSPPRNVPLGGPVPVVLFEHNVEYLIWKRLSAIEPSPLRRALLEVEWRKLRAREAAGLRGCGPDDRRVRTGSPTVVRARDARAHGRDSHGRRYDVLQPAAGRERPARLVFTGSMDWHPNEDAVLYFAETILPLIQREISDVSLAVVGRRPTERLRAAAERTGILVSGTVDDVRPYIGEAAVYVVPLRAGGGHA